MGFVQVCLEKREMKTVYVAPLIPPGDAHWDA